MTHTSTEQPEALRLAYEIGANRIKVQPALPEALRLAEMLTSGVAMIPEIDLPEAAAELRRLHARVQELEASQAQRVPLSDEAMWKILDKTHNLPEFDSYELDALFQAGRNVEAACIGFTQEKHG